MKDITKKYSNGEVTIVWKPNVCIHSTRCFRGLPGVFNPQQRPWITPEGGSTATIIAQVKLCPSGALSYYLNQEGSLSEEQPKEQSGTRIEPSPNGPLLVHGEITVKERDGSVTSKTNVTAFCR